MSATAHQGYRLDMVRVLLTIVILAAASLFALQQFGVVSLGGSSEPAAPPVPTIFELVENRSVADLRDLVASDEEAGIDARDGNGQTPLMRAAALGDRESTLLLVDAGADVNATDPAGWSALMHAARHSEDAEVVQLLLFAGADPTITGSEGETAASLAVRNPRVGGTRLMDRLEQLSDSFNRDWPAGYVVPVEGATISSRSTHLPGAARAYRNGTHEGFDFYHGTVSVPIEFGTPIHAVASGVVIRADHDYVEMTMEEYNEVIATAQRSLSTPEELLDKLRGMQVWIEHPGGFVSRYAHLSAISEGVQVGARINQGDLIAATGNSGTLEAAQLTEDDPHPHVEIWYGNERYLGQGLDACEIYPLAAQVFGVAALPPFTESCPEI